MTEQTSSSNESTQSTAQEAKQGTTDPQLEQNLREELNRLGGSFMQVLNVAWNSDQRRELERDLKSGLNSLASNLEEGFQRVTESQEAKELIEQAEEVAESVVAKVRQNEVAQELGQGLLRGLQALSTQIEKFSAELQPETAAKQSPPAAEPQDIPVAKEDREATGPGAGI
jgi:urease accessory protein UreF